MSPRLYLTARINVSLVEIVLLTSKILTHSTGSVGLFDFESIIQFKLLLHI
jgi:hypothetical protein